MAIASTWSASPSRRIVSRRSPWLSAMCRAASMMRSLESGMGGRLAGMVASCHRLPYCVKAGAPDSSIPECVGRGGTA